jgi:hypothetical protein
VTVVATDFESQTMRNRRFFDLLAAGVLLLAFGPIAAASDSQPKRVAVDDFGYLDTSNEPTDQTEVHQKRLQALMAALRGDISSDPRFQLVPSSCAQACADDGPALADRIRAAAQGGAQILVIGRIHKLSTLVQGARAVAIDTDTGRVVLAKLFSFRGDSDAAWQRAERIVSEEIRAGLAGEPAPSAPAAALASIKLAVFPFELEDTSAAADTSGDPASDATSLADSTDAIRQLLAKSGRYQLVEVSAAGAEAAKAPALRDCNGCDSQIALGLGADQSLVGVVRRISRTEYIVGFRLRDARTGAVLATADSGLRMGANYSWSRGATQLVRDHLLEGGGQQ